MIYITLIILLFTILLYIIIKDKRKVLKITGIVTIISGILTILISFIIKYFIITSIKEINLSVITDVIILKSLKNTLFLITIGIIELIIAKTMKI